MKKLLSFSLLYLSYFTLVICAGNSKLNPWLNNGFLIVMLLTSVSFFLYALFVFGTTMKLEDIFNRNYLKKIPLLVWINCIVSAVFLAFFLIVFEHAPGVPKYNGQYVLSNHGEVVKYLTQEEYYRLLKETYLLISSGLYLIYACSNLLFFIQLKKNSPVVGSM